MNKRGFTLIELLAVIVILAIIAFISVPIILNVIDKSKKGAKESSVLGYVDAVEKQVMTVKVKNQTSIEAGTYTVAQLSTLGVAIKGDKPTDTSVFTINNKGKVIEGWATFEGDNYKIYYDGRSAIADKSNYKDKNGTLHNTIATPGVSGPAEVVCNVLTETCDLETIGSQVRIANEVFYVLGQEDATHVKLLAKWNLNVGTNAKETATGLQDSDVRGYVNSSTEGYYEGMQAYGTVTFSKNKTWTTTGDIYTNEKENGDYLINIAEYVDNYVTYLTNQGANVTGRLIRLNELFGLDCRLPNGQSGTCPKNKSWIYQTSYWAGSIPGGTGHSIFVISSDNIFKSVNYSTTNTYGVRPVIILEK